MKHIKKATYFSFLFMLITSSCQNSLQCAESKEFATSAYSGKVLRTFIDPKNHRAKTVMLSNASTDLIFPMDTSGFYSFINKNDSVVKKSGKNYLTVIRSNRHYNFQIFFGCPDDKF